MMLRDVSRSLRRQYFRRLFHGLFHGFPWRRFRQSAHTRAPGLARRLSAGLRGAESGSGTVVGAALILMVSVLLAAAAGAGHVVIRHAQARSAADLAALSAAIAWRNAQKEPCAVAATVAKANGASLASCRTEGDYAGDVLADVAVDTALPIVPRITASARAGPAACR